MKLLNKTRVRTLGCSSALALVLGATGAQAEVTAADVWADWEGYFASAGYGVSADVTESGGTLTVNNMSLTIAVPEEDATVNINMGDVTFSENGDGSVSVGLPAEQLMKVMVDAPGDEDVTVNLDYTNTDFVMTVTGEPGNMTYQFTAGKVGISMRDIEVEGQNADLGTVAFAMSDVAGTTMTKSGNLRSTTQSIRAGALNIDVDVSDPSGSGETIKFKTALGDVTVEGSGSLPLEMDLEDLSAALADGFDVVVDMGYTGGQTEFSITEGGDTVAGMSSSDAGALKVAMGAGGLTYDISADGAKMSMSGGDIPLPIELAFGKAGFNLTMPVSKGDEEQDYAMGITLGDFTMSDLLWSMVDPMQQFPRDPATIDVDLSGKAKLFFDLFDPEQMEAVERGELGMPGELNKLDINALTVSAAGAELTGKGGFTFDNTDLMTFDGVPAPDGSVELKLVGGNGLLDKLIGMGLVPEEQAMGVRMMMSMFAVPGAGEDELNSTIEVKPSGEVLANGQRLR